MLAIALPFFLLPFPFSSLFLSFLFDELMVISVVHASKTLKPILRLDDTETKRLGGPTIISGCLKERLETMTSSCLSLELKFVLMSRSVIAFKNNNAFSVS